MSSPIKNKSDITTAAAANNNANATATNSISLDEIKQITEAMKHKRAPASFGERLAAARSMAPKAFEEQDDAEDGGVQLPVHPLAGGNVSLAPVHSRRAVALSVLSSSADANSDARHPRKLLVASLRLLRSACVGPPGCPALLGLLDTMCPVGGEIASESDVLVPGVVYTVTYEMTDKGFDLYQQMVLGCPIAHEVQKLLSVGGAEFDLVNEKMPAFNLLLDGNGELEKVLREQVSQHRLGVTWDLRKSVQNPYKNPT
jgi:hypothetical protein